MSYQKFKKLENFKIRNYLIISKKTKLSFLVSLDLYSISSLPHLVTTVITSMSEHDNFITDCELKTRQILHATAKQRVDSKRNMTPLHSKTILPTSSLQRAVTNKNKPMLLRKVTTSLNNRRPIERDFYKKRNANALTRKLDVKKNDEAPPLESSVLRKMYRCDDSVMLDKEEKAKQMQAKFESLQRKYHDGDAFSSDSSSDEEDNGSSHVIHDFVERLVESENQASLQRAAQFASSSIHTQTVKQMWYELELEPSDDGNNAKKISDENEVDKVQRRMMHMYFTEDEDTDDILPLSTMKILDRVKNTSKICPSRSPLGQIGIWTQDSLLEEEEADSTLFQWPSPSRLRYPKLSDTSQAFSYFYSKPIGRDGETCVTVLNSLSFKSPIFAPFCYAPTQGFLVPPISQHECVSGPIPHITFPGTSLMNTKLDSRLDTLLRRPIVVVDPAATAKDHMTSNIPNSLEEFDGNGFRRMTFAEAIEYDDTLSTRSFGISAAIPNKPTVSPPITYISHECCTEYLSRERTAADYHYIIESDGEGTQSEPYLFMSHMSAYQLRNVSKMSVAEQKKLLLEANDYEAGKLNELSSTLRLEGGEQLAKQRLADRVAKIKEYEHVDTKYYVQQQTQAQEVSTSINLSANVIQLTIESEMEHEKRESNESNERERVLQNPIGLCNVAKGNNELKLKKLEDNRKLAKSRATPTSYERQFATETKSLFIRDLTLERLKLFKGRGNQKKIEDSVLSEIQHQRLDEILKIPVSSPSVISTNDKEDDNQRRTDAMDPATKAFMAVKNHNLPALEELLDNEGVLDVDTRDQHGNTLFILACQQGNKKLARFLLRRGSYINAQNNAGNTALHYLNEYNHTNLADWLVRKGADDTLKNAEGLTAYEGVIFSI